MKTVKLRFTCTYCLIKLWEHATNIMIIKQAIRILTNQLNVSQSFLASLRKLLMLKKLHNENYAKLDTNLKAFSDVCTVTVTNKIVTIKCCSPTLTLHVYLMQLLATVSPTNNESSLMYNREIKWQFKYNGNVQASAVADEPARRAASRQTCCKQRWTHRVINLRQN